MLKSMETGRLILRSADEQDEAILQSWENAEDYREYVSDVKIRHHLKFIVCLKRGEHPIGVLYTFSYNKADGFMFLNVFIEKRRRKLGYGAEACILAICNIFEHLPVYKIYCDAFSQNTESIAMMRGAGLKQEGLLKGHRLYRGKRYDVVRFAVHHENLPRLRDLLHKFQARK